MSDLGRRELLTPSRAQLPVSAYFDDALLARELEILFRRGPGYVGHELMVPEPGDYQTLAAEHEGRVLVRSERDVELLSNVCRHRQAIMLNGRGNTGNIVCPLHRWTYNLRGELLGAPHFRDQPCASLARSPLQSWRGMLFDGPRDIAADLQAVGLEDTIDFGGFMLSHVEIHECEYNWKTFLEVYLEDYHVGPFHPGLGKFVSCDDLEWTFGDWFSVQTVGLHEGLRKPGSPAYRRWHEEVIRNCNGELPRFGAVWLAYYPNIMVEYYPNVLVISSLIPRGPQRTTNIVEFYYPEEIALFEPDFVAAERAAYMETCVEDDEIALRMDAGRRALLARGRNETGPYQSPMEDGMQHFHEFYRRHIDLGDR
ncbi:MAG: aromatic ring-hydroxylating dioxygenase subunit alpha [Burkholderiaceae bacterium]|jgi:phenylpropionate dioxygenase-like ring-hydroxylating dioxygenase large terminal subunit|nr:aromatic ring-hydroxylating dioxygenase subunit alpha [Burkholderiaceae bacterium]MEB2318009.1 aromatic ring-hydroxylating dioxygenase subunit alpha [Pseudomonadota bacterium]